MFNVWFIFGYIIVAAIVNLALPLYKGVHGYKSGFQWIMVIIYFYGYLYQSGRLMGQKIPIVQIAVCRVMEIMLHTLILKNHGINWSVFAVLLVIDFVYVALLMFDKLHYEYIEEEI